VSERHALQEIIAEANERFGTDLDEGDRLVVAWLTSTGG